MSVIPMFTYKHLVLVHTQVHMVPLNPNNLNSYRLLNAKVRKHSPVHAIRHHNAYMYRCSLFSTRTPSTTRSWMSLNSTPN